MTTTSVDFEAIKAKQHTTWSSGDYAVIGTSLQVVGENLCEAVDVLGGARVLDVAAGNGNASLAAARRRADVVASDCVGELLARAQARAQADGLRIETRIADAEALPFADGEFDVVLSTFGVMFAPNQEQAAAELVRVCKPGGRIGLANWTPDSFVGGMLKAVTTHVPPPAGVRSPLEWGTEARLSELLGAGVTVAATAREYVFRYRSRQEWLDVFRSYYGPVHKAFVALDTQGQASLEQDLLALAEEHNTATDGSLRAPSTYLEVVATKA